MTHRPAILTVRRLVLSFLAIATLTKIHAFVVPHFLQRPVVPIPVQFLLHTTPTPSESELSEPIITTTNILLQTPKLLPPVTIRRQSFMKLLGVLVIVPVVVAAGTIAASAQVIEQQQLQASSSMSLIASEQQQPPKGTSVDKKRPFADSSSPSSPLPVYQTSSGLKYIDLIEGSGPSTPQYGQLVSIAYSSYIKLPASSRDRSPRPQQYDNQPSFLFKHGNGRMIAGLDEGIHTMRVGGKRRLLIPPKLAFTESGLGPLPPFPLQRYRLNRLLEQMIELKGGTLIMEVQLLGFHDDEADQGYYQDSSLSPEEFETLKNNLQQKAAAAAAAEREADNRVI